MPSPSMRRILPPGLAFVLVLAGGGDPRYLRDFEFIVDVVKREAAALKTKGIDWDAVAKRFRPRFEKAADDGEHVRNVMELLATLRDSHTGVVESKVQQAALPGKFDGLFGAGLWFGWDQGKTVLRGVMKGHAKAAELPLGSILVEIAGEPAWLALERERRRVAQFQGISSDHSFFASLGNRMLPFGERQEIEIAILTPAGKTRTVAVARWGPGGKAFQPGEAFLPEGTAWAEGAIATMTDGGFGKKVGFLEVTGGMDERTAGAFDQALDRLKGLEALLLDCRAMGGGSDDAAWRMNGRFFPKGADNGTHGKIAASGGWQFDGPVVLLQGSIDVSSAETFIWAMTETGRAVSVGRPTGGWGIIPKRFECPSGLVSFRLGVNDRPTPIKGVHTEGTGWPPDVLVPFGPEITALGDPENRIALEILRVLAAGVPVDAARAAFRDLFAGNASAFRSFAKGAAAKVKGFDGEKLAALVLDDLRGEMKLELALLRGESPPDVLGASRRLPALLARARAAGLATQAAELEQAVKAAKAASAAQEALLAFAGASFSPTADQKKAWLAKHGGTLLGAFVRERLWK
jgi:hypothetical protein